MKNKEKKCFIILLKYKKFKSIRKKTTTNKKKHEIFLGQLPDTRLFNSFADTSIITFESFMVSEGTHMSQTFVLM